MDTCRKAMSNYGAYGENPESILQSPESLESRKSSEGNVSSLLASTHPKYATETEVTDQEHSISATDDFEALFAKDAYKSLTSVSRPLFKEMTEKFLEDPRFRSYVESYIRPPVYTPPPSETFRFLDLPIELRLRVAEYALHVKLGLRWKRWDCMSDTEPERSFGGFPTVCEKERNAFGLIRTCRQLREETSRLIFKVNILMFSGLYGGVDEYWCFRNRAGLSIADTARRILISIVFSNLSETLMDIQSRRDDLKKIYIHLQICDWDMDEVAGPPKQRVRRFVTMGHKIQETMATFLRLGPERCRVYPFRKYPERAEDIDTSLPYLEKYASTADFKEALDWIHNGPSWNKQKPLSN